MQSLIKVQVVLWLLIATVWGRDFHNGVTVDWGKQTIPKGNIHVWSNAIWSMINNHNAEFRGNIQVDNDAGLYVSSVTPKVCLHARMPSLKYGIVNNGVISFNAIKGARNYRFKIMGNKFLNNGDFFLAGSGEGSVESYIKSRDWHNNGLLHVYQLMKSKSYTYLGYVRKTMVNNGQICFTNQNWKQHSIMLGKGCVTAQGKSSLYFKKTDLKISEDEIFYLSGGETSIMAVGSKKDPQTFHVRGFGTYDNGVANKIGLTGRLKSPAPGKTPWSYNARDGILTLYHGLYHQNFEIGTGYDFTKFQVVTDTSRGLPSVTLGAVQYNGPPPNAGMPGECKPCKAIPSIPGVSSEPQTYAIDTSGIAPISLDDSDDEKPVDDNDDDSNDDSNDVSDDEGSDEQADDSNDDADVSSAQEPVSIVKVIATAVVTATAIQTATVSA